MKSVTTVNKSGQLETRIKNVTPGRANRYARAFMKRHKTSLYDNRVKKGNRVTILVSRHDTVIAYSTLRKQLIICKIHSDLPAGY